MTKFKTGGLYRNKYMKDVDFWISKIHGHEYVGYWVLRTSGRIMSEHPDRIKGLRMADWRQVDET